MSIRYIVELKKVPLQREHIGQVVEYYGLMRQYFKDAKLAMILVSPLIPPWRATYLEELGIRCVEITFLPEGQVEIQNIQKETLKGFKSDKKRLELENTTGERKPLAFEDAILPANADAAPYAKMILKDSLEPLRKRFAGYDIVPYSITRASSLDYDYETDAKGNASFQRGGIWLAYRFGNSEDLPPNDVPNVSIMANSTGLDITLNAELKPSREVLLRRIAQDPDGYNRLLKEHGGLWLKTYLKFEQQPRFYHWILADHLPPGSFDAAKVLALYKAHEASYPSDREKRIGKIKAENRELKPGQAKHLEGRNHNLNLAIRHVVSIGKDHCFWVADHAGQLEVVVEEVGKKRQLIKFLVSR